MNRLPAPDLPDWLERLVPFERYRVDVGDAEMHVMESGSPDGRPVVLLHGNPTWGFLYRKVAAELGGEPLRANYGHKYAYAVEMLCWHFGERLPDRCSSAMRGEWADAVDLLQRPSSESAP